MGQRQRRVLGPGPHPLPRAGRPGPAVRARHAGRGTRRPRGTPARAPPGEIEAFPECLWGRGGPVLRTPHRILTVCPVCQGERGGPRGEGRGSYLTTTPWNRGGGGGGLHPDPGQDLSENSGEKASLLPTSTPSYRLTLDGDRTSHVPCLGCSQGQEPVGKQHAPQSPSYPEWQVTLE